MAERVVALSRLPTQASVPRYLGGVIPFDAEDWEYRLEGRDPQVQLFNDAQEEKAKPNYSDYERWREERADRPQLTVVSAEDPGLQALREAYGSVD